MDVDRLALDRPLVGEHFHAVDQLHDAVGLVADQPRQRAVLVAGRLLEQLRRAANAGQRILDLVRQHGRERDHRARGAAMGELAIHLVGDRALLQHDDDMVGPLRQRRDMQVDQALAGIARRARSTLYSLTAAPRCRTCSISASSGLPNGTSSRSRCRRSSGSRGLEELFRRDIGVGDLAVGAIP